MFLLDVSFCLYLTWLDFKNRRKITIFCISRNNMCMLIYWCLWHLWWQEKSWQLIVPIATKCILLIVYLLTILTLSWIASEMYCCLSLIFFFLHSLGIENDLQSLSSDEVNMGPLGSGTSGLDGDGVNHFGDNVISPPFLLGLRLHPTNGLTVLIRIPHASAWF